MGEAFRHARVAQRAMHQHEGQHLQQPVLDLFLQLWDLATQVVQDSGQRRAGDKMQRPTDELWVEAHDPCVDIVLLCGLDLLLFRIGRPCREW